MFEIFLRQWDDEKQRNSFPSLVEKHGEAFLLAWSFYFFLSRYLRISNKEYQLLITDIAGPRMFQNIDRSNYDQVLKAIEKECTIHSTKQ